MYLRYQSLQRRKIGLHISSGRQLCKLNDQEGENGNYNDIRQKKYTCRVSLPLVEYSQQLLDEAPPHRNPHQNHGAAMAPVTVSHFSKNK